MDFSKINDSQLEKVVGGTESGDQTMKWCEKCQDTTPHNEKGECMVCNLTMDNARYRF